MSTDNSSPEQPQSISSIASHSEAKERSLNSHTSDTEIYDLDITGSASSQHTEIE